MAIHDSSCGCPDCEEFHPNRFDSVGQPTDANTVRQEVEVHPVLFNTMAVFEQLRTERPSTELTVWQVSDVLDAIVHLIRSQAATERGGREGRTIK